METSYADAARSVANRVWWFRVILKRRGSLTGQREENELNLRPPQSFSGRAITLSCRSMSNHIIISGLDCGIL
ncbi:hypothetical protein L596_007082 [Steinernema carpocapsae]|uniref:Uncharacterized protein n=1 Tax=Steinernema carpocapsae TaxID=34508 RepID=A0A4U5P860_STECR|nr:hypothetical protein L596_007082 [Steinernema carpocapsae]